MNKLFVLSFLRHLFIIGLIVWLTILVLIFGLGFKVQTFNPNDDLIKLIEQSENKTDWQLNFENDSKTKRISLRIIITPKTKPNESD